MTNTLRITEHSIFHAGHALVLPPGVKIAVAFNVFSFNYNRYVKEATAATGTNLRDFVDPDGAITWLGA